MYIIEKYKRKFVYFLFLKWDLEVKIKNFLRTKILKFKLNKYITSDYYCLKIINYI